MLGASVRTLVGKPSGAIVMPTDFYGKSIMSQYPFSNYSFTLPGVGAGGGGPSGYPGKVKATIGASAGSSVAPSSCALMLRAWWADSNSGTQTFGTSRDAVFLSSSTTWNATDLANMGITYTDVTTTSAGRSISVSFNLDDRFIGGYYTITRSGPASLSLWSSGTFTAQITQEHPPAGRGGSGCSWSIPAPSANQLIVLAYQNATGFDSMTGSMT
jgi:hypothetical protein